MVLVVMAVAPTFVVLLNVTVALLATFTPSWPAIAPAFVIAMAVTPLDIIEKPAPNELPVAVDRTVPSAMMKSPVTPTLSDPRLKVPDPIFVME